MKREEGNIGACIRIVDRVQVSAPLTEAELRRIAQEIIDKEKKNKKFNALGFFFYLPGTGPDGIYTAGKADWAPNGVWFMACDVKAGDYSRHQLGAIQIGGGGP